MTKKEIEAWNERAARFIAERSQTANWEERSEAEEVLRVSEGVTFRRQGE